MKQLFVLLIAAVFVSSASAQTREDAFAAAQQGKWDKAITIYSALTKAKPDDQDAWLSLSNAYMAKGDKAKAIDAVKSGFTAKSDGALAFVCNARQLLFDGKAAEADEQFKRAASKGKKDVNALRHIGESYMYYVAPGDDKPNRTRCAELLKNAYDLNGKDFNTLMAIGLVNRDMGNGGEAVRYYEYASQFAPKNPLPPFMMATVYRYAKIESKFLESCDAAIALDNGYTPALRAKADYLYFRRKFKSANEAYKELIDKGREVEIEDEMQYANTLFLNKDYTGCATLVESIINKDGSKSYLRRLLGYSYYENKEYDKAQATMDEYFRVSPPDQRIARDYIYQGRLFAQIKKDTMAAIQSLKEAMLKDTAEWGLQEEVANLYYQQKKWCEAAGAFQILQDSLRSEATSSNFYKLGYCYFYCKADSMRYQKAFTAFKRVSELSPNSHLGPLWMGKSMARQEPDLSKDTTAMAKSKFGGATPYFEKAAEVMSATPDKYKKDLISSYEYLVYAYYVKGDQTKTRDLISKLLVLSPDNVTGKGILNEMDGVIPPPPAPK
jgi:tetratricopeptide (TPR) repeat protein